MHIAIWETESSDRGVEGYWKNKPSDKTLETYFKNQFPDEFGEDSQTIYWHVEELKEINTDDSK